MQRTDDADRQRASCVVPHVLLQSLGWVGGRLIDLADGAQEILQQVRRVREAEELDGETR